MSSSVCPCTLLELHVGSPRQQPTGVISAHVMALTHKPFFGQSVSQKSKLLRSEKYSELSQWHAKHTRLALDLALGPLHFSYMLFWSCTILKEKLFLHAWVLCVYKTKGRKNKTGNQKITIFTFLLFNVR